MIKFPLIEDIPTVWNYKKFKKEKGFQKDLVKWLKEKWFIVFHPPDVGLNNKFLDLHMIDKIWQMFWLELKVIKNKTFNISKFELSQ